MNLNTVSIEVNHICTTVGSNAVPLKVQGSYLLKSHTFLASLIDEETLEQLYDHTLEQLYDHVRHEASLAVEVALLHQVDLLISRG